MNNWQIFSSFLSPLAAFGVAWFTVSRSNKQSELDRQDRRNQVREEAIRMDKDRQRLAVKEFVHAYHTAFTQYLTNMYTPHRGNFNLSLITKTDDDAFFKFLNEEFGIFAATVHKLVRPLQVEISEPHTQLAVKKFEAALYSSMKNFKNEIVDKFWEEKEIFPFALDSAIDVLTQVAARCLKYEVTKEDIATANAALEALDKGVYSRTLFE